MELAINLGTLKLKTPIIAASGTFGYGEELVGLVDFTSIGAIITKTITVEPRSGNPPPRIYETSCGVLNSIGLENPGLEKFLQEKLPALARLDTVCIVSIGGFSFEEYESMVRRISSCREIKAIEVNLSCPNIRLKKMISQDKAATARLIKTLRPLTDKVLIAKITPETDDIVAVAAACRGADADAISLVNTFYGMALNIETGKPYLGNGYGGYSGKAIKPMALYRTWQVAKNIDIPIIAGGGVESSADVIEFIMAGATAVSVGTLNFVYPNHAVTIARGLRDYGKHKKIKSIEDVRGSAVL
ncbi:MAG: dihydroorotate dehydrogenase [Candidatus Omnitrophota bacterium]|nr:dihydroorotate dehydrogenase [Candidatus Omnitrophota bacterium]